MGFVSGLNYKMIYRWSHVLAATIRVGVFIDRYYKVHYLLLLFFFPYNAILLGALFIAPFFLSL